MASRSSPSKKYLSLTVYKASGQTQDNEILWEPSFTEGFVKIEVKGGEKISKVATHHQTVADHTINWTEELRVEIPPRANEMRIMLCKDRPKDDSQSSRRGTTVVAACGIFVNDILEAVPIDKYFELFKPGDSSSGLGGFVRISMRSITTSPGRMQAQAGANSAQGMSPSMTSRIQQQIAQYGQEQAELGEEEPKRNRYVACVLFGYKCKYKQCITCKDQLFAERWFPWLIVGAAAAVVLAVKVVRK